MPKITIYGDPVGMAAMKCIGGSGKVRHQLVPNNAKELRGWQAKIVAAAQGAVRKGYGPYTGPISITLTVTVPRPKTVTVKARPWPTSRSAQDIDHHARAVYDALTQAGLITDDSLICHTELYQCYPDTPSVPDRLDRPGVVIRIDDIPTGD